MISQVTTKVTYKQIWLMISLLVIIFDQVTKLSIVAHLEPYQPLSIAPMVNFFLAYNTGAAFSFLTNTGEWHRWFFGIFSALMSIILIRWLWRTPKSDTWQGVGFALLLGGALGNLIDRLHFGHVIDFIDVYYKTYHWPVFNIADSAICIGAVCLGVDLLKRAK